MAFEKKVDTRSRKAMTEFLKWHFRYHTADSWNRSTSYACNMKIYRLDLPEGIKRKLYDMLDCQEVHDEIRRLTDDFGVKHGWVWQAGFNGRSDGYLVLYHGEARPNAYKSFCRACGQKNFRSVKETGNVCGKCRKPERVDFPAGNMCVHTFLGTSLDMDEDFADWSMSELKERVKLVQEFDSLADRIVEEAKYLAENFSVQEETHYEPKTRKILLEAGGME